MFCRHLRSTGHVFGERAIELAGRVVLPELQGAGIGTNLLEDFIKNQPVSVLTTYTRNPSVLRMIRAVSSSVYPLDDELELQAMAAAMDHASLDSSTGVTYHLHRYGEEGLFKGFDPAERSCESSMPLKQRFTGLMSVRNALVVAARIKRSAI